MRGFAQSVEQLRTGSFRMLPSAIAGIIASAGNSVLNGRPFARFELRTVQCTMPEPLLVARANDILLLLHGAALYSKNVFFFVPAHFQDHYAIKGHTWLTQVGICSPQPSMDHGI